MIETARNTKNEPPRDEDQEPRGPVAHKEVDIGDPPDATPNTGEETAQSGGSSGSG